MAQTPVRFAILGFGHHAVRRLLPAFAKCEHAVLTGMWRKHYNQIRPHSSLGYRPPAPESIAAGPPPLRYGGTSSWKAWNCSYRYWYDSWGKVKVGSSESSSTFDTTGAGEAGVFLIC